MTSSSRQGRAEFQPRAAHGARPALRGRQRIRRCRARACGIAGTTARSSPTRRPATTSTRRRSGRSNHKGRFFQVKGPLNIARCPQGHPVIIQAGGSPAGLELAARTADVVFSVVQELRQRRAAYADLKGRMAKYGRAPDADRGAARRHADHRRAPTPRRATSSSLLQSWLTPDQRARLWSSSRIGYDVSGYPLDGAGAGRRRRREAAAPFRACCSRWRGART